MKKFYIISLLSVFLTTPAWAADTFICSYTTQISPQDKLNSSGKSIISGYDKKASSPFCAKTAPITTHFINAIKFDTQDCQTRSKTERNDFEHILQTSSFSTQGIAMMIDKNPIMEIQIYRNNLKVRIIQE